MKVKAKESPQVQKARKKIKQQLADADKRINAEALAEMSKLIQRQILRKASDRIDLKSKMVTFFDENTHPAQTESRFVHRLLKQLQTKSPKGENNLEGRVASLNS